MAIKEEGRRRMSMRLNTSNLILVVNVAGMGFIISEPAPYFVRYGRGGGGRPCRAVPGVGGVNGPCRAVPRCRAPRSPFYLVAFDEFFETIFMHQANG